MNSLREQLAAQEHERWSRWMKYLFSEGVELPNGSFAIDPEQVQRWLRQMTTAYVDLSEQEKDSDRKEADKTIELLVAAGILPGY